MPDAQPASQSWASSLLTPREEINYSVVAGAYAVASVFCVLLFTLQGVLESIEGWWVVVRGVHPQCARFPARTAPQVPLGAR